MSQQTRRAEQGTSLCCKLEYAAKQSSGKTLQLLIDKGINEDIILLSLITAATHGSYANLLAPKKAGAVNTEKQHFRLTGVFKHFLISGNYNHVKMMIKAGADVNVTFGEEMGSSLIFMARRGDIECAKLVLNAGADVNVRQVDGHTALKFCIERHQRIPGEKEDEETFVMLLFAAGEKVPGTRFEFNRSQDQTYYVYIPTFLLRMSQRSLCLT